MIFNYKYDFSIVMAYYNRKPQTLRTLIQLQNLYKSYNYEVIIVDDNSRLEHQLDNEIKNFTFPINYIKISKEEKGNRINPCLVYNKGFKAANGKMVIIQNPECIHFGDLLGYLKINLTYNNYITFSCYNCPSDEFTKKLLKNINLINDKNFLKTNNHQHPWYNHPKFRPCHYHFCSGIMNDNLKILGGFDEEFAKGHWYDDDELLLSIKNCLKINIQTPDPMKNTVMVVHQWHSGGSFEDQKSKERIKLINKNKILFEKYKTEYKNSTFQFPKLLHLYWDGSNFSYLHLLTVLSFKKYHVGWKINIYCPKNPNKHISWESNEQKIKYTGENYINKLKEISNVNIHYIDTNLLPFKFKDASEEIKSDYFRYFILNKYGGIWSDFDIIFTNNIEEYHKKYNNKKFICYAYQERNKTFKKFPVAFFIAHKNNSILNTILKYINLFYNPRDYQCLGERMIEIIMQNYRQKNPEILKKIINEININELIILHANCYLKIKWNELDILFSKEEELTETYENNNILGIHWFNGSDKAKEYQNNLNIKDLRMRKPKCLIDKLVKKYI